MTGGKLLVIV